MWPSTSDSQGADTQSVQCLSLLTDARALPAPTDVTCGVVTADLDPSGRPSFSPERSCAGRLAPASLAALLRLDRSFPSMFLRQVSRRLLACSSSPVFSLGKKYSCSTDRTLPNSRALRSAHTPVHPHCSGEHTEADTVHPETFNSLHNTVLNPLTANSRRHDGNDVGGYPNLAPAVNALAPGTARRRTQNAVATASVRWTPSGCTTTSMCS